MYVFVLFVISFVICVDVFCAKRALSELNVWTGFSHADCASVGALILLRLCGVMVWTAVRGDDVMCCAG
eukprot:m.8178 g.8178  ORF g.8178 m.8178 type:complete len:69 (+) comp10639_c0_seq1:129-335(+)